MQRCCHISIIKSTAFAAEPAAQSPQMLHTAFVFGEGTRHRQQAREHLLEASENGGTCLPSLKLLYVLFAAFF